MRSFLMLLLLVTAVTAARAQCAPEFDWSGFYPPSVIDRVALRSAPGLRSNFEQVILPRLTDHERRVLRNATLDLSQREYPRHPINFYAAQGGRVVMPLSSVRLVSDLTLALAWLNRHRQPEKRVFDYVAMLAYRGPAPDGVRAQPLTALGVPADADSDPAVEALFQKMFGTIMVFVMAHETGHLFHGYHATVDSAQSRAQESEADAFAIDLMARIGAAPIGVSFYFMMAAPFECPGRSTHPLSGERISRLSRAVMDNGAVFARDKPSPMRERQLIEGIVTELQKVATMVDDPDVRAATRQVGMSSRVADFAATTPPGQRRRSVVRQAFDGGYEGKWTDSKGTSLDIRMALQRQSKTVRGKYEFGMGSVELEGTVDGDQLSYAWRWGTEYFGRGRLRSNASGQLEGTWGYTQRHEGGGTLTATPK
jgi:hypothetical protein